MNNGLGNKQVMARNIQKYMDINGKTRQDMCNALGIKYTTLTDWIKGNTYPRIDKIELMANYFGISKSDLVEDNDTYPPQDPDAGSLQTQDQAERDLLVLYRNGDLSDAEKAEVVDLFRSTLDVYYKAKGIKKSET